MRTLFPEPGRIPLAVALIALGTVLIVAGLPDAIGVIVIAIGIVLGSSARAARKAVERRESSL